MKDQKPDVLPDFFLPILVSKVCIFDGYKDFLYDYPCGAGCINTGNRPPNLGGVNALLFTGNRTPNPGNVV